MWHNYNNVSTATTITTMCLQQPQLQQCAKTITTVQFIIHDCCMYRENTRGKPTAYIDHAHLLSA